MPSYMPTKDKHEELRPLAKITERASAIPEKVSPSHSSHRETPDHKPTSSSERTRDMRGQNEDEDTSSYRRTTHKPVIEDEEDDFVKVSPTRRSPTRGHKDEDEEEEAVVERPIRKSPSRAEEAPSRHSSSSKPASELKPTKQEKEAPATTEVPRVTVVFLGFKSATNPSSAPPRKVVAELKSNRESQTVLDLLQDTCERYFADDEELDPTSAYIYTGDFSLLPKKSPAGVLRDGDFVVAVSAPIPADTKGKKSAPAASVNEDEELPVRKRGEKTREVGKFIEDDDEPIRPKSTRSRHEDEEEDFKDARKSPSKVDAKKPSKYDWADSIEDVSKASKSRPATASTASSSIKHAAEVESSSRTGSARPASASSSSRSKYDDEEDTKSRTAKPESRLRYEVGESSTKPRATASSRKYDEEDEAIVAPKYSRPATATSSARKYDDDEPLPSSKSRPSSTSSARTKYDEDEPTPSRSRPESARPSSSRVKYEDEEEPITTRHKSASVAVSTPSSSTYRRRTTESEEELTEEAEAPRARHASSPKPASPSKAVAEKPASMSLKKSSSEDLLAKSPSRSHGTAGSKLFEPKSASSSSRTARPARKRALLIGINYFDQKVELKGCVNDVKNVHKFITTRLGYSDAPEDMMLLTDDQKDRKKLPTFANIVAGMKWLVDGAQAGDHLYLHYSGHGSQIPSEKGDEEDGMDDTLVPSDYLSAGQIVDDDINLILVHNLPKGVHFFCTFDCCHSGTMLDLPYTYDKHGRLVEQKYSEVFFKLDGVSRSSKADVICLSGCLDDQVSADTAIGGQYSGALSYALLKVLGEASRMPTYEELVKSVRDILKRKGYKQLPQISAGHMIEITQPISL
ncbi:hypothetical protein SmJEL517_g03260 [Synchytrium microbalum]|uniref:Peptidase C14 caspase domain-containing protein n=1 Tax=Synchytrium microbalum TaxID=1806994 RepID=A0A507C930_9FUNG|nr:uncharacterized protein SmJEL517_g03260 [Synchytrium microbalum]TPX34015.1 hypothetical protein SmJEL517_g03260 [Synchytrium microbalum]